MKTWDSHRRALEGARHVTSVVRRNAVRWTASAVFAAGLASCTTTAGGTGADGVSGDSDVASLLDVILGDTATTSDGADNTDGADGADAADAADAADGPVSDTVADEDAMADGMDGAGDTTSIPDAEMPHPDIHESGIDAQVTDVHGTGVDVATGDVDSPQDAGAPDVGGTDSGDAQDAGGPLPATCYQPTDMKCVGAEDCVAEGKVALVCVDGICNEQDMTPNEAAQACCNAQYAANNFGVPGCNPWGPPAPPIDRGYRLADFRQAA